MEWLHINLWISELITLKKVEPKSADSCKKNRVSLGMAHDGNQVEDDWILKELLTLGWSE